MNYYICISVSSEIEVFELINFWCLGGEHYVSSSSV